MRGFRGGVSSTCRASRQSQRGTRAGNVLQLEWLETRDLLSATAMPEAQPLAVSSTTPVGLTPAQVKTAYGFTGVTGDGSGQTIAVIDAYSDPNIVNDLAVFSSKFGLAQANISVVNQSGGANLPAANSSWVLETSLDVEWAHAIAPGAKILLVEANSSNLADLLAGVNYARGVAGVSVVSMSWGSSEFSSETAFDSDFTTPAGHTGETFVAAAGDSGAPGLWPALSSNVLAVGGTTLNTVSGSGAYLSESAWGSSGGGTSVYETEPSYQSSVQSTGRRTSPDVSYDANPTTGFAVYTSVASGGVVGWTKVGGTSGGTPQWAGLIAIADQDRAAIGLGTLSGAQSNIYSLPSSDFHDVSSGSNGRFSAIAGYDEVTGRGTPIANLVIQGLVGGNATVPTTPVTSPTASGSTTTSSGAGSSGSSSSSKVTIPAPAPAPAKPTPINLLSFRSFFFAFEVAPSPTSAATAASGTEAGTSANVSVTGTSGPVASLAFNPLINGTLGVNGTSTSQPMLSAATTSVTTDTMSAARSLMLAKIDASGSAVLSTYDALSQTVSQDLPGATQATQYDGIQQGTVRQGHIQQTSYVTLTGPSATPAAAGRSIVTTSGDAAPPAAIEPLDLTSSEWQAVWTQVDLDAADAAELPPLAPRVAQPAASSSTDSAIGIVLAGMTLGWLHRDASDEASEAASRTPRRRQPELLR